MSLYFGVKAIIIGDFILTNPIKTYFDGYQVSIFKENEIYKILLIKIISADSPLQLKLDNGSANSVIFDFDNPIFIDYIKQLQQIEALGGFHYGITKILYRETLELIWYSGKDVFQDLSIIFSMKKEYKSPKKKILSQNNLSSFPLLKKLIPNALIPYNYFREANGYLKDEQYRQAYLHFYMLLEYCFANGKTRRNGQIEEFEKSIELRLALLNTLEICKENNNRLFNWIRAEVLTNKKKDFSLENILNMLFDYRGILAHGIERSAKYVFDDRNLRQITIFISLICYLVCGNMQVYCMFSKEDIEKRLTERISELQDKLELQCI